ncbi:MAG: hypothetical protein JZU53_07090 [Paludibacter sp.]|nr:hypothetical protein [Paludibacter sp.]
MEVEKVKTCRVSSPENRLEDQYALLDKTIDLMEKNPLDEKLADDYRAIKTSIYTLEKSIESSLSVYQRAKLRVSE